MGMRKEKILFGAARVFAVFVFFAGTSVFAAEEISDESARVVVVANSDDPESLDVAAHYMRVRGIPEGNLVALPMPTKETVSWREFGERVFSPLRREFVARGWIDGVVPEGVPADAFFRAPLAFPKNFDPSKSKNAEKISFVVLCRGVPLRIANAPELLPPLPPPPEPTVNADGETVPAPERKRGPLDVNCASADSEIALLGVPETAANGAVLNPFFKDNLNRKIPAAKLFLRVARLDGITAADAKALADGAVAAEEKGLLGRAYVDIGGPHAQGDKWLALCAEKTRELGFGTSIERSRALMDATARYDAPALYFGWYSGSVGGFFRDPNFRFPAGAVAIHIHSFSATSMRSKTAWTPGLVARGAAATVGNVYEPYLGMSHYPHYFLEALAEGKTAGEAAAYSIPVLSWQGIFVGDPLYRPLKKSVEAQMTEARRAPTRLSQYAFLRAANLAAAGGDAEAERSILKSAEMSAPGLALNFALAEKEAAEKGACSRRITVRVPELENPGLMLETARLLAKSSRAADALGLYSDLLDRRLAPDFVREKVLREACDLARSRGDSAKLAVWHPELERLLAEKNRKGGNAKK